MSIENKIDPKMVRSPKLVSRWIEEYLFYPEKNDCTFSQKWKGYEVTFSIDGESLQGWYFAKSEAAPLIIYYGSNAEDVVLEFDTYHERFPLASLFIMNYRGFGNSTGRPSEKSLLSDALALFDHCVEKFHVSPSRIVLIGRSLGSSVASYVASQRQAGGLILITPFDQLSNAATSLPPMRIIPCYFWLDLTTSIYPLIPLKFCTNIFTTSKYLSNVHLPILVIAAEKDGVVPKKSLDSLISAYKNQITVVTVPGTDHQSVNWWDWDDPFYTSIDQYIEELSLGVDNGRP